MGRRGWNGSERERGSRMGGRGDSMREPRGRWRGDWKSVGAWTAGWGGVTPLPHVPRAVTYLQRSQELQPHSLSVRLSNISLERHGIIFYFKIISTENMLVCLWSSRKDSVAEVLSSLPV